MVAEALLDGRDRHLVVDRDVDDVVQHRQRRHFLVLRNEQAARPGRGRDQDQCERGEYGEHGETTHDDLPYGVGYGLSTVDDPDRETDCEMEG